MVEVMFSLGFFTLEGNPSFWMRVFYCGYVLICVFSDRETERETVRENRGYYSESAVGFVSSILLDNIKEGQAVWGGRSPNWVNHVYLCLSGFMCFVCLYFLHILCDSLLCNI